MDFNGNWLAHIFFTCPNLLNNSLPNRDIETRSSM